MPTYAQLQTESWWARELVTPELDWLGDELCRRTRRPRGAFGNKGDNNHLRGAHRSQEWILKSRYCTSRTYTVQAGLTAVQQRHVAGVDFTPGSAAEMVAQCKRIYTAVRTGTLEEVREFYGNVDGDKVVDGWDNVRNRAASSDSSHLWHWHLTLDRRCCADRRVMERILAIALGDPTEEDVDDATIDKIATRTKTKVMADNGIQQLLARVQQLTVDQATLLDAVGRDTTDEKAIVDGVLAGLGQRDIDDVAAALKHAFGERAAELAAKLGTPAS
ncbi:hypothetical protein [Plantactinospora endophytica]|uniref:Uncharacterized protein n=1 Tax=Plantactinospora endophytica TaxID=673535 RepID=A0ABQ4DSA1_9ACTN|nr:hypothetical protein [Plantactinospora endophytica]GIG85323.1 hypothetical protein Pen02_02590 [Plantactinospora endophytica]